MRKHLGGGTEIHINLFRDQIGHGLGATFAGMNTTSMPARANIIAGTEMTERLRDNDAVQLARIGLGVSDQFPEFVTGSSLRCRALGRR